jgi:hypothetical protein
VNLPSDLQRLLPVLGVGAVALIATLLVVRGLGGAGESRTSPKQILDRALAKEPRSGKISAHITFSLQNGATGAGGELLNSTVSGEGEDTAVGKPSREVLHVTDRTAGKAPASLDELSTGERGYIRVDGQWYRLSDDQFKRVFEPDKQESFVESLGFDPRTWIRDPKQEGVARVGGVAANHISGDLDAEKMLTDLEWRKTDPSDSAQARQFTKAILGANKSGKVQFFAGKDDGIFRKIDVTAQFDSRQTPAPLRAIFNFSIGISDVNQPVNVKPPAHALQPSRIASIPRERLGSEADDILGSPSKASSPSKPSRPSKASRSGDATKRRHARTRPAHRSRRSAQAYVGCVQSAQDLQALDRCQSLLP